VNKLGLPGKGEANWPVISKCLGCEHIKSGTHCDTYMFPETKWSAGNCPRATNVEKTAEIVKPLDPIKASKRKVRGK